MVNTPQAPLAFSHRSQIDAKRLGKCAHASKFEEIALGSQISALFWRCLEFPKELLCRFVNWEMWSTAERIGQTKEQAYA